jgi:DNA-binding beta-propeller fold protein YncE
VIDTQADTIRAVLLDSMESDALLGVPAVNRVYAGGTGVAMIDAAGDTNLATITVGCSPRGLAYDPAGNKLYVSSLTTNAVSIISGATNQILGRLPVGDGALAMLYDELSNKVYCANRYGANGENRDTTGFRGENGSVPIFQ